METYLPWSTDYWGLRGPSRKISSSWRKFIRPFTIQPESTSIPDERITAKGPTVLKPAPFPEDYDARVAEIMRFLDFLEASPQTTNGITAEQ